ncbi:MAG: hypothetical protein AB1640_04785 [bacterium]
MLSSLVVRHREEGLVLPPPAPGRVRACSCRSAGLAALLLMAALSLVCSAHAATSENTAAEVASYQNPSEGILALRVADGRLSLETRDASLDKVLQELSRQGDLKILSDGPLEGRVTLRIEELPLETAIRKILRQKGVTFVYAAPKQGAAPDDYLLKEVRIFLPEGKDSSSRVYSYSKAPPGPPAQQARSRPFARPEAARARREAPPPPPPPAPPPADPSAEEAEEPVEALTEANFDELDEVVERLKRENPQVQDQIDQFLESLEEAKERARESGRPFPPMENLGELGTMMQEMMKSQGAPPPLGEEEEEE